MGSPRMAPGSRLLRACIVKSWTKAKASCKFLNKFTNDMWRVGGSRP